MTPVVTPATGRGTRLQLITETKSKGLVDVVGKPLVGYPLQRLIELGVDTIIVILGHLKGMIINRFGHQFQGIPINYVCKNPRGLVHAIGQVSEIIEQDFLLIAVIPSNFHSDLYFNSIAILIPT